jgi:hypothetical protein
VAAGTGIISGPIDMKELFALQRKNKEDTGMDHTRLYLKKGRQSVLAFIIFLALLLAGAQAAWAFTAVIYSPAHPNTSYTVDFNTFDELFATIEADPPANHIPGFDAVNDPLKVDINYAGALVTLDIPAASTDVTVAVPALGLTQTFTGATRGAALTSAETEFTDDPNGTVAALDNYVETSSQSDGDSFGSCFITSVF